METIDTIALMLGAAWASGINLYAAILVLGWLGGSGHIDLPPDLQVLSNPLVMLAAGGMYAVEFFADKVPGVDTGWDALHTFIRIPAGAVLAAGSVGEVGTGAQLAAGLVGGTLATGSHATKAGSRVLINTSPEPVSNWFASVGEDIAVIDRHGRETRQRIAQLFRFDGLESDYVIEAAKLDEIKAHDFVLTPGRYVGAEDVEDDGEPFAEKMARLSAQLKEQFEQSDELGLLQPQGWCGAGDHDRERIR